MMKSINSDLLTIVIIVCCILICEVHSRPLEKQKKKVQFPTVDTFKFLTRFGYLDEGPSDVAALYNEDAVEEAIKNVQKFGALPETGIIDNATLNLMVSPRCGREDIIHRSSNRQKRYTIGAHGWKRRHLTFFVANWSPQLSRDSVANNIQKALDAWGKYGRLQFKEVSHQNADIIVAFASANHGDGYSFDGPGNIVAHAFYPYEHGYGGDVHFDAEERWTVEPEKDLDAFDFYNVALHELGHSLGLGHSPVRNSVMFPYYQGYGGTLQLEYDDILAMYQLYIQRPIEGNETISDFSPQITSTTPAYEDNDDSQDENTHKPVYAETTAHSAERPDDKFEEDARKSTTTPTPPPRWNVTYENDYETVDEHKKHDTTHGIPPTVPPLMPTTQSMVPDICEGNFDTVAVFRGELFFFKGEYLWRLRQRGQVLDGYPVPFRHMFPDLPTRVRRIDAAFERNDGMIILFSGKQYWVYDGYTFVENSPRPLTDFRLPPILDKLDAVLLWNKNTKTYFFRREMFWRSNGTANIMDRGYPQHIMQRWRGIPEDIDAAIVWSDGHTYFFKGTLYWRFDNVFIKAVDEMIESCPKKRMLLGITFLGILTVLVLIVESHWTEHSPSKKTVFPAVEINSTCGPNEKFVIKQECQPCTDFEIASQSIGVCIHTRFKEILQCANGKTITRSCDRVAWLERRTYWTFMGIDLIVGVISTIGVMTRKKVLTKRTLQRLQRQLASEV